MFSSSSGLNLVWGEPPAAECGEDEGNGGGLEEEQAPVLSCLHQWDECGDDTGTWVSYWTINWTGPLTRRLSIRRA